MTENEALEYMKLFREDWDRDSKTKNAMALDVAISALEEVQQYRAIGTVSEFRQLKEKAIKKVERHKDKHYCECGCPVEIMLDGITLKPIGGQIYCDQCGAKLDWSEFVAEKGE